ncbi:MAG TPA: DNA-directed RNA polymerase subunit beta', partial [Spirochaetota bacterium]|nr:DNA-directed RNA polymerase subunit beta' [Spirochaetota bacterium]
YACGKKEIGDLIAKVFAKNGPAVTVKLVDAIKELGFRYATHFAPTISVSDIIIPPQKDAIIAETNEKVEKIEEDYRNGFHSNDERFNLVVNEWTSVNDKIVKVMMDHLSKDKFGFNNIYVMAQSGARGSKQQIKQLAGMRGLMAKPSGEIIDIPIRSNFKEGLNVLEYFISTNGARKGLADTALKTADAGYLTRRLVDISQDVVITMVDCGTTVGIDISAIKEGDEIIESLGSRVIGRTLLYDLRHPVTDELICSADEIITEAIAKVIDDLNIDTIEIRSVLTCEARHGACAKCYGRNLATSGDIDIGEAVGIIAAQSIGQPGTQLTMRTFHIGGIATGIVEEGDIRLAYPVYIKEITSRSIKTDQGKTITVRRGYIKVQRKIAEYELKAGAKVVVNEDDKVYPGTVLAKVGGEDLISKHSGLTRITEGKITIVGDEHDIPLNVGAEIKAPKGKFCEAKEVIAS